MKSLIKLTALIIAAVMTASLLAACAGGDTPKSTETTGGAASSGESAATETEGTAAEQTSEESSSEEQTGSDPETGAEITDEEPDTETEPEQKALYDVYRWDFDDPKNLGWESSSKTDIAYGEDGTMILTVTGADPNITTKKLKVKIDCENVEYIVMRIKNNTDSDTGQLFISTTDSPGPNEKYSYKYDYEFSEEDGDWEIIEIDTLDIEGWTGYLRNLRLDYSDGQNGECIIDYIALQTTDEKKAGVGETEEEVDPRKDKSVIYTWDFTKLTADDIYLSSHVGEENETEKAGDDETPETRWHFSKGVEDAYVENGHLVIKVGNQDPFMVSPDIDPPLDCDMISAVVIKACNKSDMSLAQFFFSCDGEPFSEAASVRFSFEHKGVNNDVWEEIVINPKESTLWTGNLESIRIDPTESWDGIILIDSCELFG